MCSKFALVVSLLCLATFVASNDIVLGNASPYSKKIYSAVKIADPALWRRTDDIMINAPYHDYITAVYITDLRPDKEGEAYIEAGGLGSKTVTIALKSPSILRGYKFAIEVYAQSIHTFQRSGYMSNNYYNNAQLSGLSNAQYPSYPSGIPMGYPNRY